MKTRGQAETTMTQEKKTETFNLDKILAEVKDKVAKRNGWYDWVDLVHWHQSNELEREVKEVTVAIASVREECGKLQKFKDYVHKRLDDMGIPIDPESPHKAAGCRIGGRLDFVKEEIERLKAENEQLKKENERLKEKDIRGDSNE